MSPPRTPGTLVVSLDFELHWGVRDHAPVDGPYAGNLHGARRAVPAMLERFAAAGVHATWATVGALCLDGRDAFEALAPEVRPCPSDPRDDPYREPLGRSERDDPLHFAPSLVRAITSTPHQELACHGFAHLGARESFTTAPVFEADLDAACAAAAQLGASPRAFVWPRNQVEPARLAALARRGFVAHRGTEPWFAYREGPRSEPRAVQRAVRLVDALLPVGPTYTRRIDALAVDHGVVDVPSSRYLRTFGGRLRPLEPLALPRVLHAMDHAAAHGELVHLWWHPHNFGVDLDARLALLDHVLRRFARLADRHGMVSRSMGEVADVRRAMVAPPSSR